MAVQGNPRSFHNRFAFEVEIDGFVRAKFEKMSELQMEIKPINYWEGGALTPNKSPGRAEFKEFTLERGASTGDDDFLDWVDEVIDAAANTGLNDNEYKRNMDVVQKDRDGSVIRRWTITGAWPCELVAGEWDNTVDEKVIQKLKICYDYFKKFDA